jgi:hypothetical protein
MEYHCSNSQVVEAQLDEVLLMFCVLEQCSVHTKGQTMDLQPAVFSKQPSSSTLGKSPRSE